MKNAMKILMLLTMLASSKGYSGEEAALQPEYKPGTFRSLIIHFTLLKAGMQAVREHPSYSYPSNQCSVAGWELNRLVTEYLFKEHKRLPNEPATRYRDGKSGAHGLSRDIAYEWASEICARAGGNPRAVYRILINELDTMLNRIDALDPVFFQNQDAGHSLTDLAASLRRPYDGDSYEAVLQLVLPELRAYYETTLVAIENGTYERTLEVLSETLKPESERIFRKRVPLYSAKSVSETPVRKLFDVYDMNRLIFEFSGHLVAPGSIDPYLFRALWLLSGRSPDTCPNF